MSQGDFFDEEDSTQIQSQKAETRRRRTRTIALVALGGVSAFGVYACVKSEEDKRMAQQANGGAVNGQQTQNQAHYRPSFFPWFWLMNRGGSYAPTPMPGATSGFNAGGGTATAGRAGAPTSAPSTSTSRGGFGSFGRALSGLS